jgi:hypothetical protein
MDSNFGCWVWKVSEERKKSRSEIEYCSDELGQRAKKRTMRTKKRK